MVHGLHRERERYLANPEPSKAKKEREEEGEKREKTDGGQNLRAKSRSKKHSLGYQEEVLRHHHYYPEYINSATDLSSIITITRRMFSATLQRFASKIPRYPQGNLQWMPTLPLILLHATHATPTTPANAIFRIQPQMTKHEVKEYLTKIYNLPVVHVRTQNYLGKRMKIIGKRKIAYAKRPDYKKAFVTFDGTLADTGMGSQVDGLPGQQQEEEGEEQQQQIEA